MISMETLIQRSVNKMGNVREPVRRKAVELIELAYAEGIYVQISSGYRSYEEQAKLYGQGRPDYHWNGIKYGHEGRIVTHARPGESVHNEGRAVDFFLVSSDGKTALWTVNDRWRRVAAIAKSLGFNWGGEWHSFPDYPHLEWPRTNASVYQRGDTGSAVKEVQRKLLDHGYHLGEHGVDGRFGPVTEAAVRQFQEDHAIDVDGIVGPVTQALL